MPISLALNHSGHITAWSADAAAWFGRPAEEVLGTHCRSLFTDSALDALYAALSDAAAGQYYSGVTTVAPRDDIPREVLLSCSPLLEGEGSAGLLCQITDLAEASWREGQTAFVDALMRASPFGLGMIDNELRYVFVNDALAEFNGVPAKDHIGRRVGELVRAADGGEYEKHLRNVLESGEPLSNVLIGTRSRGQQDRDKVWSVSFFRLTDREGKVLGLGGLVVEVTERETALLEASAFRHRLALVNRATSRLGTTLEMGQTARELTDFVVPDFADAASVEIRKDFLDGGRSPSADEPVTTVRLAGRSLLTGGTAGRMLFSGSRTEHVHEVGSRSHGSLSTGRPWRSEQPDRSALAELAHLEGEAGPPRKTALGSVIVAPLVARGRALGLVEFARSAERAPLDEEDLKVAEELAARAALSLDNARLYAEERRVAVALQRNMLPDDKDLPQRPGLEIAYYYRASSRSAKVGGDWFDVIPLSGHRIALVVGDMMGHDIQAAAGMGQMRTAMHTLARLDLEPVDLLSRLDKIVEISPAMQYATCVYAVYNTVTRECGIANAGHPAPVLWHPDRTTEMVPVGSGVPLGIGLGSSEFTVVDLLLPENSALVLYTDGLIERRHQDVDVGIETMREVLASSDPSGSLQQQCDNVVAELKEPTDDDDLAVLMASTPAMPGHRSVRWRVPPDPGSASHARSLIRRELRAWGLEALQDTAELLTSELITNALGHARGEIVLQMAKGGTLVIEVADDDERLPHRTRMSLDDDSGRGLTLVSECAQEWGARSVTDGKVVWFELALPGGTSTSGSPGDRTGGPGRRRG